MELTVQMLETYLSNMNAQMLSAEGMVRRAERALDEANTQVYRGQGAIDVILSLKNQAEQQAAEAAKVPTEALEGVD